MVTDVLVWLLYAAAFALCVIGAWAYYQSGKLAKREQARAQENAKLKEYEASGLSPAQVNALQRYLTRMIEKERGNGGTNA